MDIKTITNDDRKYSLFAILSPEAAKNAEDTLSKDSFTKDNVVRCYQGENDARAFLERHDGFVGTLRKMFVGHQVDVDTRYAKAARTGDCVIKVHIGQEYSDARDRAETIILEAGGRDVYFFGGASYRDVVKRKKPAKPQNTHPSASG
jgi:hypothetical protein